MKRFLKEHFCHIFLLTCIIIFFISTIAIINHDAQLKEESGVVLINQELNPSAVLIKHDNINHVCYIVYGAGEKQALTPWLKPDGTPMIWGVDWPID